MHDPQTEERIKELTKMLKTTGIAASETRAREMAEDIVRTEARQRENLERRQFDPHMNPQQRVGHQGRPADEKAATRIASEYGIDTSKTIAELLAEEESAPQPVPQPAPLVAEPQAQSPEPVEAQEPEPTPQEPEPVPPQHPQNASTPASSVAAQELFSKEDLDGMEERTREIPRQESARPQVQTTAPPKLEGANPAMKAFNMFQHSAQQQQQQVEQRQQAPEPVESDDDRKAREEKARQREESKVDLTKMFNFNKR